ncbi:MAG: divergent polysaccharide deacetylase family protein [Treponema sp.]|nr:divergent polysaccharide deacetylase family protein [Candidatus Treponema equifaecale]
MAEQKKTSGTAKKVSGTGNTQSKKTTSSRTATKRKTKAKKPKVKLSTNKVYILTAVICFLCCAALFFSVKLNSENEKEPVARKEIPAVPAEENKKTERSAEKKSEKVVTKPVENKTVQKVTETKPEPKKTVVAKTEAVKTENKTPAPVTKPVEKKTNVKEVKENVLKSQPSLTSKNSAPAPKVEMNKAVPSVATSSTSYVASAKTSSYSDVVQEQVLKSPFDIPPAQNGATIVLIIDDAGRSAANTKLYAQLPFPLTIAVLPKQPQTRQCAQTVLAGGKEMILHQPMQAENLNINPGPGAIRADMSTFEIAATIKENLAELGPGVKGLNNHEGSLITANEIKIGAVLDVCSEKGVYFLDSRTTAATKAKQAALERDMFIFEKAGPYIDNEISREKMLERMLETLAYANRHSRAIVIGHVDKSAAILPELLTEMYPYMKRAGYKFATPSMIR